MAAKGKTIKVKISDGVKASAGGGAGSAAPGIRPTRHDGGGGGQVPPQESKPTEVEKKQSQLGAYQQRAAAAQQQYQQQKEAGIRESQEAKERVSQKTTTGVYEKGGAVIRETKGDYQTLQKLKAQQPGSAVVQTQSGEYVLIKSQGLNLGNESTLAKVNENIQREGGTPYSPTEKKLPDGGTLYIRQIKDSVAVGEPVKELPSEQYVQTSPLDLGRPTKYTADVGSSFLTMEQGIDYKVKLSDSMGGITPTGYQKTRAKSAREQAEEMTRGESPLGFIGPTTALVKQREEQALVEQGAEGQVFPITYTTEEGKPLVTITGKSEGAEYNIYQKPTEQQKVSLTPSESKIEANKIFPFPLEAQPGKWDAGDIAKKTYIALGIDLAKESLQFGVPQYTKPIKENLQKYRAEVPIDILAEPERYGEIPELLKTKEFQVSAAAYASTLFIPGKKFPKLPSVRQGAKVKQVEKKLMEPGIVGGREKLGEGTYLISKGTELKPAEVPLTLVKFKEKGKPSVTEIIPERKTLSPSEINIQGSLFPGFVKSLEVKKIGQYQYKSAQPSISARKEYARGVVTGGIKPLAEGRKAPLSAILKGKSEILKKSAQAPRSVYAQTQAEKFRPPLNPNVPKQTNYNLGLRQFDYGETVIAPKVGAGQAARGFTPQQTETLKGMLKTEARLEEKTKQDFLGTINAPVFLEAQAAESQVISYPLGTTPKQITRLKGGTVQKEETLVGQKLTAGQQGKLMTEQASKLLERTTQKTQLKSIQKTELLPRLITRPLITQRSKLVVVPKLIQKQQTKLKTIQVPRIPFVPETKLKIPRIPFFVLPQLRKKQRKETKETKSAFDWKGNVPEFQIEGVYKKYDIIYGEKRIAKLLKEERFGKPKRRAKEKTDILGFPKTKKAKSSKWAF